MSSSSDSLLGKQLDEYRIDKPLGAGGMAHVYRALDTKLRRYVALKVIAPNFRVDSEYTTRFEREAQSIARLEHPNIVRIYRFGEVDSVYYMAMQYIEGADVSYLIEDYRSNGEVMPIADVVRVIEDIGAALDYMHGKGIIHRDVKPGNIMVDNQGRAYLTDFGLALLSDLGTQGEIFGSPHYLAPEQAISSANVVPQSDLYSLGITLFEMLTGELPFTGGESLDIAMRHVSEPAPPPSRFNKAVPASVDALVRRCLEKEPYDRYQTGAELTAALKSVVAQWQTEGIAADREVRRPSLVMLPHKVSLAIAAAPLPDLPPTQPRIPPEGWPAAPDAAPTYPTNQTNQRNNWRSPLLVAGTVFVIGLLGLILLILATRGDGSRQVSVVPTATETVAASPTSKPPTLTLTFTVEPVQAATTTPVVLPTTAPSLTPVPPTPIPPTAVPPALPTSALPTQALVPPDNRDVVPPGSRRLGEFAVEWYCNDRGHGVALTNGDRDWACTNRNGSVAFVLASADFDNICQTWYKNPVAFAIRDQQKAILAHNWSCYEYVAAPTATTVPLATPSARTLFPRVGQDWVALVNVSSVPLSVDQVEFRRDGGKLQAATAWGRSALMPGECLRLYRSETAPGELPPGCNQPIDYTASRDERTRWFEGKVTIFVNPSTTYCYPSDKCGG